MTKMLFSTYFVYTLYSKSMDFTCHMLQLIMNLVLQIVTHKIVLISISLLRIYHALLYYY